METIGYIGVEPRGPGKLSGAPRPIPFRQGSYGEHRRSVRAM